MKLPSWLEVDDYDGTMEFVAPRWLRKLKYRLRKKPKRKPVQSDTCTAIDMNPLIADLKFDMSPFVEMLKATELRHHWLEDELMPRITTIVREAPLRIDVDWRFVKAPAFAA